MTFWEKFFKHLDLLPRWHRHVLKTVGKKKQLFTEPNFRLCEYMDKSGKRSKMYLLDRDFFSFYVEALDTASQNSKLIPSERKVMNELVQILKTTINGAEINSVNLRDLWEKLESKQKFADFAKKILSYSRKVSTTRHFIRK